MGFAQPYKLYALWMNHEMDSDFKMFEIRKPDRISIEESVLSRRFDAVESLNTKITAFWTRRPRLSEAMNYQSTTFMLVREHSGTLDKLDDILPIDFCMKKSWPKPNSSVYYSNDRDEYSMEFEVVHPQPHEYFKFAQILDGYVKKYSKLAPQPVLPDDVLVIDGGNIEHKWRAVGKQFQENKDWISKMTNQLFPYRPAEFNPYAGPMPRIEAIFYNDPYTTVKWNDGSVNTVKCAEGEKFSKELGVSVIIAKKYLEVSGCIYPRAGLKRLAESGIDQTAKTKARKEYKAKKKSKK